MHCRASTRTLPFILCLVVPVAVHAQPETVIDRNPLEESSAQQQALEQEPGAPALDTPAETHATREAPAELIGLASREPEQFIGKKLVLSDGAELMQVGPVLAVRQRLEDQRVYLIVDATEYFNSPTEYAVAVGDLDRIEGDTLVTPAAPGMHLMGLDYYPEDYEDLAEPVPLLDE